VTFTNAAPIVTRRHGLPESWTLKTFVDNGGYAALRQALTMRPEQITEEVLTSNLLGRGGAGFEAGRKWSMLRKAQPVYLVVNGDESEPSTFKDHMLLENDPHQLIEGVVIASYAIGASQAFIYVRGEFALAQERVQAALNEAYQYGAVGADIFGSGFTLDVVVHNGAGAYICGEETALLESLEGKRGFPRIKPPYFPAAIGLYGAPTVVNNVETLSNLGWIVENGGAAFAALGVGRSTGTRIFSLSGHVARPGNYEIEMVKHTFRDLIYDPALGGGVRKGNGLKAFIPGGASAPWFGPQHLDVPLGQNEVAEAPGVLPGGGGSMLGSGSVVVMDETTCAVRAAWRLAKFFSRESCGQCTPCREGTGWVEKVMFRIEQGAGRDEDLDLLFDVCDNIAPGLSFPYPMTTICFLGPSVAMPVISAIQMFRDEFHQHIKEGACPYG
jgi:NADH-quinone oxidoreductase subunit F